MFESDKYTFLSLSLKANRTHMYTNDWLDV